MENKFSVLGKKVSRKDAFEKATGKARFIPDIQMPGMLHAKFLRSPHAHAKIKQIDTSRAKALPGVKCVLTFKDVPKVHPQRKFEFLLDRTVHHPGEEVAAVAALTPRIAEEALKLIEVEYEVLPAVVDAEEALRPGAPLAHQEYGTNVYRGTDIVKIPRLSEDGWLRLEVGDIEQGFKEADYILEGDLETPMQYNCSPMPRSVVCDWEGDKLTCWADTQLPLFLLRDLSASLKVPQANIRIIAHHAVGGYGGKSPEKTATLAAIMAKKTGRPVKAVLARSEDFVGTHHRISYRNHNRVGLTKDGKITAMYSKIMAHWGSDTVVPGVCQASALLGGCSMLYRCPNTKAESQGILTNILGYGPMNGFGDPEAIYAIEVLMDRAAEKINMDPVEFRLRNCMRYGDRAMEYEQVLNGPIEWGILGPDLDSFPELIEKCAEKAGWKEKWKGWGNPMAVIGYRRRGIGVAIGMHHCSFWPSSAIVKMNQDGSATVLTGAVEIGQGYASATAQVVAEALGIRYEDVNVITADTGAAPAAIGNVASSGTSSPMNSARIAAEDARRKILELASARLGAPVDQLEARDRRVWIKGTETSIPIADICFTNWQITGTGNNPPYHAIRDEKSGKVIHAYAAAVTIAEIEVDSETGKIDLLRVVSGHDTGRSINPIVVENQIDLGLVMASGWVLSEEYKIDGRTGVLVNPNLLDYKLMTFLDMPVKENHSRVVVERPSAWGPFGAKGFSETAMTALGPAIANALYNATGIRVTHGSLIPENVLKETGNIE
ncbi:MAG: xanthine dehydrogenase family protein molybdopterin-binding subunit [Deltaproteobacteria bacterium]|nr:xanthine dehydrogenase family protein molybdopterin-binding subunit [Deltaproteobacteria bacterium]MBW2065866.1 xanthine dehydrogenase family protein molybdopterin-binding subunit [Deltaproteobacteria bacterium]